MRRERITDAEADRLVRGHIPAGRSDLTALARAISEYRTAASEPVARPSAALARRLDLAGPSSVPAVPSMQELRALHDMEGSSSTRVRTKAQMFVAAAGVSAALVLGTVGAAAAVTLPVVASQVTGSVPPVIEQLDGGTAGDAGKGLPPWNADGETFGQYVSGVAKNKPGSGKEFGQGIADERSGGTSSDGQAHKDSATGGSTTGSEKSGGGAGSGSKSNGVDSSSKRGGGSDE